MTRSFSLVLAGMLAANACACAPALAPASSPPAGAAPRLLLAEAAPAPAPSPLPLPPPPPTAGPTPVVPTNPIPTPPDYGAAPASETLPSAPADSARPETWQEREDRQLARTWGWVAVSVGASAGVLAIGTSILMLEDNGTRSSNCNGKACNASGLTANGQLADLGAWNAAFWVVGVAGLGVGAFLLVTHPTDKAMGTRVGVGPNGSGASFELRSTF